MKHYCEALKSALDTGSVAAVLDALVSIAETYIDTGDPDRAADILALVLCYPMHPAARELADELFSELETQLCPRVIEDVKARCDSLTLDDLALEIVAELNDLD